MIRFAHVSFGYPAEPGKETSSVFEEVSFCLGDAEFVGLAGANGSGKSTLALLAAGLLLPSSGEITVGELDTRSHDAEIQRRVGFVFQSPEQQVVGITVEEDLAFGLENLAVPQEEMARRVEAIAERFGLAPWLSRPVSELSGGMKQKLALAGVMAMRPRLLILDEPTSQLDPWARREFWGLVSTLQEKDRLGILLISQHAADLERATRMLILSRGKLVFDGPPGDAWKRKDLTMWGISPSPAYRLAELRMSHACLSATPTDKL